jgi:hypothetical protein
MRPFIILGFFLASALAQSYTLEVFINGQSVPFVLEAGSLADESATLIFDGGKLELNLADWDTFNYAHVLAVTFEKTAENTYTVSATIRHNDTGWDNYADTFEVKGNNIQNGLRVLTHPHETEQPFTRSQLGVVTNGVVNVEARDNVEGLGGSEIYLDLANPAFDSLDKIEVSYTLTK